MRRTRESIQYRSRLKTYVGRVTTIHDDGRKEKSAWLDLRTDNRESAQKIYDKWLRSGVPPITEAATQTFEEAATGYLEDLEKEGAASPDVEVQRRVEVDVRERRRRLWTYAIPTMGVLEVVDIAPHHVASAIDAMHKAGLSKGSQHRLRSDISVILTAVMRLGGVKVNVALGVPLNPKAHTDNRPRVVPSDEHLLRLRELRGFDEQIDMALLIARDVGGQRTSCLIAGDWSDINLDTFASWHVRRPKTDEKVGVRAILRRVRAYEKVEHGIPQTVQAPLRAWWVRHSCPTSGPILPTQVNAGSRAVVDGKRIYKRRGSKVGARKAIGNSWAKPLRRILWQCGLYRPLPGFDPQNPDPALCAYQTDTATTLRTDFHSVRRAYVTALKRAKVPDADVLALAGHTQMATSTRYDSERRVETPEAALPGGLGAAAAPVPPVPPAPLSPPPAGELLAALDALRKALGGSAPAPGADTVPFAVRGSANPSISLAPPGGLEPPTNALGMRGGAEIQLNSRVYALLELLGKSADQTVQPHVVGLRIAAASAVALGDWALADKVRERLTPPPPAGVTSLSAARTRRGQR